MIRINLPASLTSKVEHGGQTLTLLRVARRIAKARIEKNRLVP